MNGKGGEDVDEEPANDQWSFPASFGRRRKGRIG